ncbi:MAG: type II toxin-antitoxin system prevent-host-death family antitoxin [Opitutales bacterium]
MPESTDIHALQPLEGLPTSPASKLKNAFKPVFQQVLEAGAVSITRNRRREAVIMSADLYDQILAELAARDPLEVLRAEYDTRFAALQSDPARKALQHAFDATPKELGAAAVAHAKTE